MFILYMFIANVFVSASIMVFYENILLRRELKEIKLNTGFTSNDGQAKVEISEEVESDGLTSYEKEKLAREFSFDARINLMKEELALKQSGDRKGTIAEEGDPLIKNLPHDIINYSTESKGIEIAD